MANFYTGNAQGAQIIMDTAKLQLLQGELAGRAEKILTKQALDIKKEWKENIVLVDAIDTAAYLNSIHVTKESDLQRTIADGVEYGVHVEHGTSRMSARPCATPAIERARKGVNEAWEELVK